MAISKKGKRTIVVNGETFLWWIRDQWVNWEVGGDTLVVVHESQQYSFGYIFNLRETHKENACVYISLRDESSLALLMAPRFENDEGIITPAGVRKLIEWCKKLYVSDPPVEIQRVYAPGLLYPLTEEQRRAVSQKILKVVSS